MISTLIWSLMAPETLDLSERFSRLYQTSISPDNVRTSIMVWPRKSSDSRVNFCLSLDFKSLSSSQTRTLIRSDELWHSLKKSDKKYFKTLHDFLKPFYASPKNKYFDFVDNLHKSFCKISINLQVKLFIPLRIKFFWNSLGPLFRFTHLDGDIGIGSTCLVFGYQALSTNH